MTRPIALPTASVSHDPRRIAERAVALLRAGREFERIVRRNGTGVIETPDGLVAVYLTGRGRFYDLRLDRERVLHVLDERGYHRPTVAAHIMRGSSCLRTPAVVAARQRALDETFDRLMMARRSGDAGSIERTGRQFCEAFDARDRPIPADATVVWLPARGQKSENKQGARR